MIVDISSPTQSGVASLKAAGVDTVIRYYARLTHNPGKVLTKVEAQAIIGKQMSIAVVHEGAYGDQAGDFTPENGKADGAFARQYAARIIGQPAGSAIYFGVDIDANAALVASNVIPYMEAVAEAMREPNGLPVYKIGVYGCGTACQTLKARGLVDFTWLSQSRLYDGTAPYKASGAWTLLQEMPSKLATFGVDVDDLNPAVQDFGQFKQVSTQAPMVLALTTPTTGFPQRLVDTATAEWNFWGNQTYNASGHRTVQGHTEGEGPVSAGGPSWYERVGDYWVEGCNIHGINGKNHDQPWSAAFISWCEKNSGAGARFLYSPRHSHYIYQGIRDFINKREDAGYWTQRVNEYKPQVGDLIAYARQAGIDYDHQANGDYPGHCDIVVAVRPTEIDVIGGNVGDSVSKRTIGLVAGYVPLVNVGDDRVVAIMQCLIG